MTCKKQFLVYYYLSLIQLTSCHDAMFSLTSNLLLELFTNQIYKYIFICELMSRDLTMYEEIYHIVRDKFHFILTDFYSRQLSVHVRGRLQIIVYFAF